MQIANTENSNWAKYYTWIPLKGEAWDFEDFKSFPENQ